MIHEKELKSIKKNIQKGKLIFYNNQIVCSIYWNTLTFENKIKIAFDNDKQIIVDIIQLNNQN